MKNNFKIKLEHKDGILYIEDTDAKYDEVGNEKEGGSLICHLEKLFTYGQVVALL